MRHEVEPRVKDEAGGAEPILAESRNMFDGPDAVRISEAFTKEIRLGEAYTRQSINATFGGSVYSGIAPSSRSGTVLLYTDPEKEAQLGYKAGWEVERDGVRPFMWYAGEGSSLTRGNRALLRHREESRVLRVFQASGTVHGSSTKVFRYVGEFETDHVRPFEMGSAPDQNGEMRQVFHFRLRPIPGRSI
jgi:5-methylcytosine-specific restriction protein A